MPINVKISNEKPETYKAVRNFAKHVLGIHRFQALRKVDKYSDGYMSGLESVLSVIDRDAALAARNRFKTIGLIAVAVIGVVVVALTVAGVNAHHSTVKPAPAITQTKQAAPVNKGVTFGQLEVDAGGSTHAPVTITNDTDKTKTYVLTVELLKDGVRVSDGFVVANDVAPGQTVKSEAVFLLKTGDTVRVAKGL